jgi:glycerol-3-phosphate dehydrogenase
VKHVDVLVIGAGIHGAGVAQAAAARGCSVLVVERGEQAGCETSRASSKLIHGGLRYLESAQFRLVYECLKERRLLLKNAPQLVHLEPFFIPVYRHSQRHPLWIWLGLLLYWGLSGFDPSNRCRWLSKTERRKLPCSPQDLRAVFQYFDAQTDDQLLTQAVMRSAQSFGAEVCYSVVCSSARLVDGQYSVQLSNGEIVTCSALVNAAGPWGNEMADRIEGAPKQDLDWVQGTHIVLNKPAPEGCFYLESPRDGRAVFILPWHGKTMVGTTEKPLNQPRAEPTDEEIEYLLDVYNHYFKPESAGREDISTVMCGTRVLPADHRNANRRSRETLFQVQLHARSAYLAIYGGKLTSYRATAAKVLQQLEPILLTALKREGDTALIALL